MQCYKYYKCNVNRSSADSKVPAKKAEPGVDNKDI